MALTILSKKFEKSSDVIVPSSKEPRRDRVNLQKDSSVFVIAKDGDDLSNKQYDYFNRERLLDLTQNPNSITKKYIQIADSNLNEISFDYSNQGDLSDKGKAKRSEPKYLSTATGNIGKDVANSFINFGQDLVNTSKNYISPIISLFDSSGGETDYDTKFIDFEKKREPYTPNINAANKKLYNRFENLTGDQNDLLGNSNLNFDNNSLGGFLDSSLGGLFNEDENPFDAGDLVKLNIASFDTMGNITFRASPKIQKIQNNQFYGVNSFNTENYKNIFLKPNAKSEENPKIDFGIKEKLARIGSQISSKIKTWQIEANEHELELIKKRKDDLEFKGSDVNVRLNNSSNYFDFTNSSSYINSSIPSFNNVVLKGQLTNAEKEELEFLKKEEQRISDKIQRQEESKKSSDEKIESLNNLEELVKKKIPFILGEKIPKKGILKCLKDFREYGSSVNGEQRYVYTTDSTSKDISEEDYDILSSGVEFNWMTTRFNQFYERMKNFYAQRKKTGYLYVRPFPNSNNILPFNIPFQFNVNIQEGGIMAQYATEEFSNRIGSLKTYINTTMGDLNLETEYIALYKADGRYKKFTEYGTDQSESYKNDKNDENDETTQYKEDTQQRENFSLTHLNKESWDLEMIHYIELMFRSLVFPTQISADTKGVLKPPLVKIFTGIKYDNSVTQLGDLYTYPLHFNNEKDKKYKKYLLYENQVNLNTVNKNSLINHKTYLVSSVNILYDHNKYGYEISDDGVQLNRGFKVNLTLAEINESYLDLTPDFHSYYNSFMLGENNIKLNTSYVEPSQPSLKNYESTII